MLNIEKRFLASKMLPKKDKQNYLKLFKKISSDTYHFKNEYSEIIKMKDDVGFDFNLYAINEGTFNQCPYRITRESKNGENQIIFKQGVVLNEMMINGYDNQKLLINLLAVN